MLQNITNIEKNPTTDGFTGAENIYSSTASLLVKQWVVLCQECEAIFAINATISTFCIETLVSCAVHSLNLSLIMLIRSVTMLFGNHEWHKHDSAVQEKKKKTSKMMQHEQLVNLSGTNSSGMLADKYKVLSWENARKHSVSKIPEKQ